MSVLIKYLSYCESYPLNQSLVAGSGFFLGMEVEIY